MTLLASGGVLLLLLALVVSVVARVRLWGARLAPATASPVPPAGSLALASRSERGAFSELVPLLAHWQLHGILLTEKSGPSLVAAPPTASAGPVWRFTAGPAVNSADPVDLIVIGAMLGTQHTVVVEREDIGWRTRVQAAIDAAVTTQRAGFGTEKPRAWALRPLLAAVSVLSGIACLVGAFLSSSDTAGLAWLTVGVIVTVAVTLLVALWPAKSGAERRYLQAVRDLGAWVSTTDQPTPALGGWAMIWNLPGAWPAVLPESVTGLLRMDRSFLRADFSRTIPEPFSLG